MSDGPFTGEFLIPGDPRYAVDLAQHLVPYLWCGPRLAGARVAEIGCGAGYGARALADHARQVDAYDRNPRAVAWAREHYRAANLAYRVEGTDPPPSPGGYGGVCSFQVLEHLLAPGPFLDRLAALLEPGGRLHLTTPNRLTSAGENPYHVREYAPEELERLLRPRFRGVEILGITGDERFRQYQRRRREAMGRFLRLDPLGLRRMLPRALLATAFPALSRAVRRRAVGPGGEAAPAIRPEDFRVDGDGVEGCDDLFAVCVS